MEEATVIPREIQPGMEEETQLSFTDWAQFISFTPKLYFRPQNLDELKRFISGQRQGFVDAQSLRVLGGLHSCSADLRSLILIFNRKCKLLRFRGRL
jgi:hypothetical protein